MMATFARRTLMPGETLCGALQYKAISGEELTYAIFGFNDINKLGGKTPRRITGDFSLRIATINLYH